VLQPGGTLAFSVWDSRVHNPLGRIAGAVVNRFFPSDPPTFYDVPFGFADAALLRQWLADAGFTEVAITIVPMTNTSPSAADAAEGIIAGNPTILAIEERATAPAAEIIAAVADELRQQFGDHPCRLPMQAWVITARTV
jgi:hypothetical protein